MVCLLAIVMVSCSKKEDCDTEDDDSPCYTGLIKAQFVKMKIEE